MSLPLSSEMLEACYDFLCTSPPFSGWNMPPGEDVKFFVGKASDCFAHYQWDGSRHSITVSANSVAHTITLVNSMAHECIHLHLRATKQESKRGGPRYHNAAFKRYAAQVCKHHGFDPKAFY